ncbi:hypothetical protein E2C01_052747 [Portunus trituberculatus]|uniref:Uncharacterized protein n=1 Tax=Portunus trituberculatus TaxID=210409 RepID=A0A5B7GP26_PORTR|nr:hypothetical protein [Portunus trituberculatus]
MPGGHHMDPGKSVPSSFPIFQEDSVKAGRPTAVPGGSGMGQCLSAPMPVGHPFSTDQSYKDEEEDVAPNQVVNEELGGLWLVGNPAVSVSFCLLAQVEKVCGSMANIASWIDQVLATWAGTASTMEQDVLEFLSALAKVNKDIFRPAEELRCRLLMLWRQAVVDSLPHTFSDREKCQLLSSPFFDVLFDPAVMARVQEDEHLAAQQRALSSVVRGLASSFRGSASGSQWSKIKVQTRRGSFRSSSSSAPVPKPSATGGSFRAMSSRSGREDRAPTVSLEVTSGSSGFPGEAGPRWPSTLSVPSVVPEKSLEGTIGSSLVEVLGTVVSLMSDNSTVVAYLRNLEGTRSESVSGLAGDILKCLFATSFTNRQGLFTRGDSPASPPNERLFTEGC